MSLNVVMAAGTPPEGKKPFEVRCKPCGHVWPAAWLPMEMDRFARLTMGLHCPACGAGPGNIFVATDEQPDPNAPELPLGEPTS